MSNKRMPSRRWWRQAPALTVAFMPFGVVPAQSPEVEVDPGEIYRFEWASDLLSPDSIDCGVLVKTIANRSWNTFLAARRRVVKCIAKAMAAGREVRTTFVNFDVDTEDGETTILLKDKTAVVLRYWYEGEDSGDRPFSVARCPDVVFVRKEPREQFDLNASDRVLIGVRCAQDDSLGERVYPKKAEREMSPNTSLERTRAR